MTEVNLISFSYIAPPPRQDYVRGNPNPFQLIQPDEALVNKQQELDNQSPDIVTGTQKTIKESKRIPRDINTGFNTKRDAYESIKNKNIKLR
jgi:hypothetical protein